MNKVIIIGNLTGDPVPYATKTGKTVVQFTVAVNEKHGENNSATFFHVSAWEKTGELCRQYLSKGRKVCVIGTIKPGAYINKSNQPVGTLEVTAREIEFLTSKGEAEAVQQTQETVGYSEAFIPVTDEGLPF